jgi:hypothetical protein
MAAAMVVAHLLQQQPAKGLGFLQVNQQQQGQVLAAAAVLILVPVPAAALATKTGGQKQQQEVEGVVAERTAAQGCVPPQLLFCSDLALVKLRLALVTLVSVAAAAAAVQAGVVAAAIVDCGRLQPLSMRIPLVQMHLGKGLITLELGLHLEAPQQQEGAHCQHSTLQEADCHLLPLHSPLVPQLQQAAAAAAAQPMAMQRHM